MELDDLKNTWGQLEAGAQSDIAELKTINNHKKKRWHNLLRRILLPELAGSAVCAAGIVFIALNFTKLDSTFLRATGILAIALLAVMPFVSLLGVRQLYKASNTSLSYAETLKNISLQKIKFCKLQKLNITLGYGLLVTIVFLLARIFGHNQVANRGDFFIFAICGGYIFLLYFSKWVFRSYNNTINKTEQLLKEMAA